MRINPISSAIARNEAIARLPFRNAARESLALNLVENLVSILGADLCTRQPFKNTSALFELTIEIELSTI